MEIPDLDRGELVIVMRFPAGVTNRQLMDVFFTELARVLNERGPDGTEEHSPETLRREQLQ